MNREAKRKNKKNYKKIAKQHGVTVDEVERDMQTAIDAAFVTPNATAQSIKRKGDTPTPDVFISNAVRMIKNSPKEG